MNSLSNERGIGLIYVISAVGIMSVSMLAFMTQMNSQAGSQKSIHSLAELKSAVQEIQQAFAVAGICKSNLQSLAFDKTQLNPANTYPDLPVPQIALPSAPSSPLVVNGAALKNLPGSNVRMILVKGNEVTVDSLYTATLRFFLDKDSVTKAHTGVVGPNTIYQDLQINLIVAASGNTETVQDCYTGLQSTSSSSVVGNDVGGWVGTGPYADPGASDCSPSLAYAVRNSGTPQSVSGNCLPIGSKCKIPGASAGTYFLETCTSAYTVPGGAGGGGGGEGDPAGGTSGGGSNNGGGGAGGGGAGGGES